MEDQDIIKEFLIECSENLTRLDREIVELEQRPGDAQLLASIFRIIHTIKGTSGFLNLRNLEGLTHGAENVLSQVRSGERDLTPQLVSLILQTVDSAKRELVHIDASGAERLSVTDSTIRIDSGLLDRLMGLVGELALAGNQILQFPARQEDAAFSAVAHRLNSITTQLREGIMKMRLQPIGRVWNRLPRVVRDLAAALGKQIRLDMDGAVTELDHRSIEAIDNALIHVLRNCCDHGIERPEVRVRAGKPARGQLLLRAFHEGGHVQVEISDDGAGIDPRMIRNTALRTGLIAPGQAERMSEREIVNLVFAPGFSTAGMVTQISGRGVGMDVVKTSIEKIGGTVDLVSRVGEGTTVRLMIPLRPAFNARCGESGKGESARSGEALYGLVESLCR